MSVISVQDLERTSALVVKRGRQFPWYPRTAIATTAVFLGFFASKTPPECREQAAELIRRLVAVEVQDFWNDRAGDRKWLRTPEIFNRYGRVLYGVAWVAACITAVQRIRRDTLPLNALHEVIKAMREDMATLWGWIEPKALRTSVGISRSRSEDKDIQRLLKLGWSIGSFPPKDQALVGVIVANSPDALTKGSLSRPDANVVSELLWDKHNIEINPDNCRMRFRRLLLRIRADADWIVKVAQTVTEIPQS
jgi:hypothetical protein